MYTWVKTYAQIWPKQGKMGRRILFSKPFGRLEEDDDSMVQIKSQRLIPFLHFCTNFPMEFGENGDGLGNV